MSQLRKMSQVNLLQVLTIVLTLIGLFLSIWIVIPAPVFSLLPLSVGIPELSPWLVGLMITSILITLATRGSRLILVGSLLALGLSLLPLLQFPGMHQRAATAMQTGLGTNYLNQIPASVSMRSAPFVLQDVFRGISTPEIRRTLGIQFANSDGVPLKMNLYRPVRTGKNPSIVVIYGGAWQRGTPNSDKHFSEYMAAQGYTVLAIDYRHAPQYQFPSQVEDIKTALEFIRQRADEYDVDLDRVALLGRSSGAHLALLTAFQPQTISIRAVIDYYGPVDLTAGYNNPPFPDPIHSRAVLRSFLGGTPQEFPELYRQASPYEYVKPSLPPSLLIYGRRDHIVQSKYGRQLYEKLNTTENKTVFIEIPWADHAFDAVFNGVSNQLALYYTERFLSWALR